MYALYICSKWQHGSVHFPMEMLFKVLARQPTCIYPFASLYWSMYTIIQEYICVDERVCYVCIPTKTLNAKGHKLLRKYFVLHIQDCITYWNMFVHFKICTFRFLNTNYNSSMDLQFSLRW